ncbi:phosphoheptose isomerase [Thermosulfurimonas marina]|uniref:Glucose-6-phosphate isomerase n=1 Tax=Thermosulfurimonas marina TaxID=2047767 RepID=A0A6H1WTR1_9BACT|nr:phosphoheptose isomerase [Thermosulfurimonas marina]QJA06582.1 phosphoheptose isomerase [Thermosulfurimonas marina]
MKKPPLRRPTSLSPEEKQALVAGLFAQDPSIFTPEPEIQARIAQRLGWIKAVERMEPKLPELKAFAEEVRGEFEEVLWCGMGGSSLFPLALSLIFGPQEGYPRFTVLDTNDPETIAELEAHLPWEKTLFVIASKSGTTVETLAHYRYFWKALEDRGLSPGPRFVALTDPGSPLEAEAKEKGFRRVFHHPQDVGGRYAALTEVGFLPAALMGLDLERALGAAREMFEASSPELPWEYNLSAWLAQYMVEHFVHGKDKLTILTDPLLRPFAWWLEQLIAESLGKNFTGIIPIVGEAPGSPTVYGPDRYFVYLGLRGRENLYRRLFSDLREADFELKTYFLEDRYEIFAECVRWEIAVALSGALMGLNPFDEPDVVRTKQKTRELVEKFRRTGEFPVEFYLDEDTGIGFLYAETAKVEYPRLKALIKKFFQEMSPWGYLGLLAYLPPEPEIEEIFRDLRTLIRGRRQCSTVFGFGPRYLHSTGQLFKGGTISGRFIIFTRRGRRPEQVIPGEGITFWDLQFAQAYGDFRALEEAGRPVIHLHLTEDYREDLRKLYQIFEEALRL